MTFNTHIMWDMRLLAHDTAAKYRIIVVKRQILKEW
jgi:hypothetical protein